MKRRVRAVVIGFAMATITACATIGASHDFNPAVNFDRYKAFSWVSPHPLVDPTPNDAQLESRIEQTARDLLTAKGYRFVDDPAQADFVIGFGLGASDKLRTETYPAAYRGPWHWRAAHDVTTHQHAEGRLVVDVFDVRTHQPAWHGWTTTSLTSKDLANNQAGLRNALAVIFANFPPS